MMVFPVTSVGDPVALIGQACEEVEGDLDKGRVGFVDPRAPEGAPLSL